MINDTVSIQVRFWRLVALVWIVACAGCTERDSTGASGVPSANTETSTQSSNDLQSSKAINAPDYSDGCRVQGLAPGVHRLSLEHGGWERNYLASVPDSTVSGSSASPLLIAMHGFGGNGAGMRYVIGRDGGLEDHYVVLYPDGAGSADNQRGWNSGHPQCCGTALDRNVDDVAFIRALVASVAQKTCVDLNRIYATGFSNGGDMAQRLACDASDVVAAVTSVAGRFDYHARACPGERPVPVVLYRGQTDRVVPYNSALLSLAALKTIPAIEGFEQIARSHKCRENSEKTLSISDTDCLRFDDCTAGFEVTLCTSASAGHCWPGVGSCSRTRQDGATDFSATDHMRDFFGRHVLSP